MDKSSEDLWAESIGFVDSLVKKTGLPGCSLGVLHQGQIKTAGFGFSNIEKKSPVNGDTLFQIGSITKTFTATLAMKLVEEGRLDLFTPVRSYLPDFKVADEAVSARVTPAHLLTHSAGWDGDLFLETGDGADAVQKYIQRMAVREQLFPLGEYFSYNNAGFAVLGGILEAITQKPLEELFRTLIVEPLRLQHLYLNSAETITYDFAVGHRPSPEGNRVARPWRLPRNVLPMGGIITNVSDLLTYARCYLARGMTPAGKQMLLPESIAEMWTPKMTINQADRTSVGYSWMRRDLENGRILSHGGGTNGQVTQLSLLPDHDFALAIFTNSDQGGSAIQEIQKFLLKTYLDIALDPPKEIASTPDQLAVYSGAASRPGNNIHLEMVGNYLVAMEVETIGFPTENDPPQPPGPPFRIGRCAEDRLIVLDGDGKGLPIDVFRDAQGRIAYLRPGRMYRFTARE